MNDIVNRRRATDAHVDHLHDCVEDLKGQMDALKRDVTANTALTQEIRDILGSFKIFGKFAKWFAAVVAAITAGWTLVDQVRAHVFHR